jgi:SAM-dependent methyltransferase
VPSPDAHKEAEIASRTPEFMAEEATKPFGWETYHWVRWATIAEAVRRLDVPAGARVLDVGCGPGWTSLFLAEAGHPVTAVDLVPANVELTARRAERWGVPVHAQIGDMEDLDLDEQFDFVLIYDALHHSTRQRRALESAAAHLRPGGWLLLGETSWLHRFSPSARRHHRERGWIERGFTVRGLRSDLRRAGLSRTRRFFGPTQPYESRLREFPWQLARLIGANFVATPATPIWIAAQRPPT